MAAKSKPISARFLKKLYQTSLQQMLALKASFVLRVFFMILNNLIMLTGWFAVFQTFHTINGWSFSDLMFVNGIVVSSFSIWSLFFRGAGIYMARLIEYGELDSYILAPKDTLLHVICSQVDPAGLGDLLSGILLITLSGLVSWHNLALVLFCITIGAILFISLNIFLGSLNFYASDSTDLGERLFYVFLNIANYPGCVYSGISKIILLSLLPAGLISILPISLIYHFKISTMLWMIFVATFLLGLSITFFKHGLTKYTSGNKISGKL